MAGSSGPFHEGEREAQRAAGEEEAARTNGPLIVDAVMTGATAFLRAQRMLVVASRDAQGQLWASVLFGDAGFVSAEDDGQIVTIDRSIACAHVADPFWANVALTSPLGLLAIDLSTRRRLRVNGHIESLADDRVVVRVEQAYPNCPKYIQRRRLRFATRRDDAASSVASREGNVPDAALLDAIRAADTVFIASGHPNRGLDASHRGGNPGFIQIVAADLLRIPDYAGNGMFNTLGNLLIDPHCGVTLPSFADGRVYQMTGEAIVHFDGAEPGDDATAAETGRSWEFRVRRWRSSALPIEAQWEFVDYSPYNP